ITDPSEAVLETLADAIRDAMVDVEAYLGRPITPRTVTETRLWPNLFGGWTLRHDDILEVISAEPETTAEGQATGYYTVTYTYGMAAVSDPGLGAIRRYVTAAAMNSPAVTALWRTVTGAVGDIRSVSAEGQSVSYGPATLGGGGTAG